MSRRTRRGGPVEELVALPSEGSEEEEEEYQSSDEEAYSNHSDSSSGSDNSAEDIDPDDSLEADDKELVSSTRKRRASDGRSERNGSPKKQKSTPTEEAPSSPEQKRSPVRKRGIAQKIKKPRAGQPAPKKRVTDRIEDDDNLAETTGSEGRATNDGDVDIEGPGRAEKAEDKTTGTPEVNDNSKSYKTKKDAPVPVVEDDDEV